MNIKTPIKVALIGMDERSATRFTTIFKMVYKERCAAAQRIDADIAIVDLDGEADAWDEFRLQSPELPAIVISESPASIAGAVFVAKPAKLDLLWESIFKLATGLPSPDELARTADSLSEQAVAIDGATGETPSNQPASDNAHISAAADAIKRSGNTAAVHKIVLQEDAAVFYNPDDYLLGHILSILNEHAGQQCSIHVQCWKDRQLILRPGQRRAFTDLTDSQLMNLGIATSNEEHMVEINSIDDAATNETNGLRSMPMDYLLWDLALRTARGRVPVDTDLSRPLYLQCWPNFTRLPNTPYGMRIASLWVDEPCTLSEIAGNLGIELSEVHSFYSAAAAIGLAGQANRRSDGLVAPRTSNQGGLVRGLCNAILRHFGNDK